MIDRDVHQFPTGSDIPVVQNHTLLREISRLFWRLLPQRLAILNSLGLYLLVETPEPSPRKGILVWLLQGEGIVLDPVSRAISYNRSLSFFASFRDPGSVNLLKSISQASVSFRVPSAETVPPKPIEDDCAVVTVPLGNFVTAFSKTLFSDTPGFRELFSSTVRVRVTCAAHFLSQVSGRFLSYS